MNERRPSGRLAKLHDLFKSNQMHKKKKNTTKKKQNKKKVKTASASESKEKPMRWFSISMVLIDRPIVRHLTTRLVIKQRNDDR